MAYFTNTVAVEKGSSKVVGANTYFLDVGKIRQGDLLFIPHLNQAPLLIKEVLSNNELLVKNVDGSPFLPIESASNLNYGVVQNFTSTTSAQIAQSVVELQTKWQLREREMTGWISSELESYPVTSFIGESISIPTPKRISELSFEAQQASEKLAGMSQTITSHSESLNSLSDRIDDFNLKYGTSVSLHKSIVQKHAAVVLSEDGSKSASKAAKVSASEAKLHSEQSLNAQKMAQSSAAEAKLDNQRAAAHSAIAVSAATNAERAESISVSTQQNIDKQKVVLDAQFSKLNAQQQALDLGLAGINDSEHRAIRAESACVMIQDQVTHTASQANAMLAQTQGDAESTSNAVIATQEFQNYTELKAKQAAANAALSALILDNLTGQQSSIKSALNAVLDNTLTKEQINTLFS